MKNVRSGEVENSIEGKRYVAKSSRTIVEGGLPRPLPPPLKMRLFASTLARNGGTLCREMVKIFQGLFQAGVDAIDIIRGADGTAGLSSPAP